MRAAAASPREWDSEIESPLLLECARGNHEAWRSLHIRYYPVTVAFLRKLGVREPDLEDASQEVFLQMHRYLPRFRGNSQLKTWLYRLCITQARHVRRRRRLTETLRSWLSGATDTAKVSSEFCEDSARRRIEAALERLNENERLALVLFDMEGLSGKQVAETLRCKEATLWRRLHDARKKFIEAVGASAIAEGLT
ncbi:MAG: polymerase sigma factor RpoE [Polyangiaceae bacterium]|jgi:RNA polymerase sigma-70 factor (ECF subfamily)|nr:polymerase sigma factor RpoE [Polyangiaceae bacterium]